MTEIVSKEEARGKGFRHYFTGKLCNSGHISERYVINSGCIMCAKERSAKKRKNNPNYMKKWREENKDRMRICKIKYLQNHPDFNKQSCKRFQAKNPEHIKLYRSLWRKLPEGQLRKTCDKITSRLRIGESLSKSKTKLLNYSAQEYESHLLKYFPEFETLNKAREAGYQIDHIVPISYVAKNIENKEMQFRVVMDLDNLQLIPAEENKLKSGRADLPEVKEMIKYLWNKHNILGEVQWQR